MASGRGKGAGRGRAASGEGGRLPVWAGGEGVVPAEKWNVTAFVCVQPRMPTPLAVAMRPRKRCPTPADKNNFSRPPGLQEAIH